MTSSSLSDRESYRAWQWVLVSVAKGYVGPEMTEVRMIGELMRFINRVEKDSRLSGVRITTPDPDRLEIQIEADVQHRSHPREATLVLADAVRVAAEVVKDVLALDTTDTAVSVPGARSSLRDPQSETSMTTADRASAPPVASQPAAKATVPDAGQRPALSVEEALWLVDSFTIEELKAKSGRRYDRRYHNGGYPLCRVLSDRRFRRPAQVVPLRGEAPDSPVMKEFEADALSLIAQFLPQAVKGVTDKAAYAQRLKSALEALGLSFTPDGALADAQRAPAPESGLVLASQQVSEPAPVRIGAEEREVAKNALDWHRAMERLTEAEWQDRRAIAGGAKYASQLQELFVDLPGGADLALDPYNQIARLQTERDQAASTLRTLSRRQLFGRVALAAGTAVVGSAVVENRGGVDLFWVPGQPDVQDPSGTAGQGARRGGTAKSTGARR